jgi:hypothetical protein
MTKNVLIQFEGKRYVLPGRVLDLFSDEREIDVDSVRSAEQTIIANGVDVNELLYGLFVVATFKGGLSCRELGWLVQNIGGNSLRPVALAAKLYNAEQAKRVLV